MRGAEGFELPELPGTAPLVRRPRRPRPGDHRRRRSARTSPRRGPSATAAPGRLDVVVELPPGHESLNVVIPWSDERVQLHVEAPGPAGDRRARRSATAAGRSAPRRRVGRARRRPRALAGGDHVELGRRRRSRRRPRRRPADRRQVDRRAPASPRTASSSTAASPSSAASSTWDYDWDDPMQPWHVVDPGGQLDIVLTPRFDKHSQGRGPQAGERDPPGVRHVVGPRCAPTTASTLDVRRPPGLRRGGPPELVAA